MPCNARDFRDFAGFFGVEFMGTWMNATGTEGDSFLEVPSALPYFPSSLPVTHRKTYWRLERSCACASSLGAGSHIVLIASFHELLLALCDACCHDYGVDGAGCVELVASVKRRLDEEARVGKRDHSSSDKTKPIVHDVFAGQAQTYFAELNPEVWARRPNGVAKPVLLRDYHVLATLAHYKYLGHQCEDGTYNAEEPPSSIFYSALFWDTGLVENGVSQVRETSYYNLYMEFQRRQPTFASLRLVLQRFREAKGVEPTLADVCKQYPMSSEYLVQEMFSSISHSDAFLSYSHEALSQLFSEADQLCRKGSAETLQHAPVHEEAASTYSAQAQKIYRDNLLADMEDVSHHHSPFERFKGKNPLPRLEQRLRSGLAVFMPVSVLP